MNRPTPCRLFRLRSIEARQKLLMLITDGKPQDQSYSSHSTTYTHFARMLYEMNLVIVDCRLPLIQGVHVNRAVLMDTPAFEVPTRMWAHTKENNESLP
ncbi:hypothetical protein CSA56_18825 [candidate division KSB3 bacterium]|uniref:Uncharacterized protein n=1 Tax=candidate division KSB3 bacterium TaxID=2044937 RepID=A0A2G6K6H6_9BACT|nr:MAG: hypothetical protein CSA56_18825 [candidate division KSB3 bacterium]